MCLLFWWNGIAWKGASCSVSLLKLTDFPSQNKSLLSPISKQTLLFIQSPVFIIDIAVIANQARLRHTKHNDVHYIFHLISFSRVWLPAKSHAISLQHNVTFLMKNILGNGIYSWSFYCIEKCIKFLF